jgi:predicted CXXCH cytochrome family protein
MRIKTWIILLVAVSFAAAAAVQAAEGPDMRVLDSIKSLYGPVKFDHRKHTMIAPGCATCHHEHNMAQGFPCKQCHALTPESFRNSVSQGFMPCKSCHDTADPDNPGMPGLKTAYHRQCFSCHKGMGNIGKSPKGCGEMCHVKRPEKISAAARTDR